MAVKNKLGTYISKLMTTVLDFKEEDFVRQLAQDELQRLKIDIEEFIRKNSLEDDEEKQKVEKQLLQEDSKNVKDK
tara:strand:+ start:495 stop:722 length:228 start_codon:yes stop_codon:yes gene_type:complete